MSWHQWIPLTLAALCVPAATLAEDPSGPREALSSLLGSLGPNPDQAEVLVALGSTRAVLSFNAEDLAAVRRRVGLPPILQGVTRLEITPESVSFRRPEATFEGTWQGSRVRLEVGERVLASIRSGRLNGVFGVTPRSTSEPRDPAVDVQVDPEGVTVTGSYQQKLGAADALLRYRLEPGTGRSDDPTRASTAVDASTSTTSGSDEAPTNEASVETPPYAPDDDDHPGTVLWMGYKTSDTVLPKVLQRIADHYGGTVRVTSGNRGRVIPHSSAGSWHLKHRAVDFRVYGRPLSKEQLSPRNRARYARYMISDKQVFLDLRSVLRDILIPEGTFEVIWHTGLRGGAPPHIHMGNRTPKGNVFKIERRGRYETVETNPAP